MLLSQVHLELIPHNCTVDVVENIVAEVIWRCSLDQHNEGVEKMCE